MPVCDGGPGKTATLDRFQWFELENSLFKYFIDCLQKFDDFEVFSVEFPGPRLEGGCLA